MYVCISKLMWLTSNCNVYNIMLTSDSSCIFVEYTYCSSCGLYTYYVHIHTYIHTYIYH